MDLGLDGKAFIVGGGSSGLGRAIATALAEEGARVLLVARDPERLAAAAQAMGEAASVCAADLGSSGGVDSIVEAAASLGRLDGVVVNQGGPPPGKALDVGDEQWEAAFRLLVGGPIRLLRGLVPGMSNGGAVLVVTSSSVRAPIPGLDTSNVLRPGVAALVKCLALELGPQIRVNSLAPGRIDTERVRFLDDERAGAAGITVDEQRERMASTIPLGRYGDAAEVGRVGAFLLSPAASYISGAAIQVDGGYVTAVP